MPVQRWEQAVENQFGRGATPSFCFGLLALDVGFSVVSLHVEERVSAPFEIDVTLAIQDDVRLPDLLDQEGLLTIDCGARPRQFHGIVSEYTYLGGEDDYRILQLHLVPYLRLLSLEQDCRIFQNMNVQDIVLEVLSESWFGGDLVRLALEDEDRMRAYCVQYRETDLNFISRLLEEEGIFYFFEHYEDKHVLVLTDTTAGYVYRHGPAEIRLQPGGTNATDTEVVTGFSCSHRLCPGKIVQRDYNYMRKSLDLTVSKVIKPDSNRELFEYPGNYFKQERGSFVTEVQKERIQLLEKTAQGTSGCPYLSPCSVWTLTGGEFEGEYVTISVSHSGSQPQALRERSGGGGFSYSNSFMAVPSEMTIRPQLVAEKPVIIGIQTATVVGGDPGEIATDRQGRVRVRFHWGRSDKYSRQNSCMIRVAQSWAGFGRGAQHIPRVGDEVVVQFADGNPDRPLITGSVYNGLHFPIHDPEKHPTRSGFRTRTRSGEGFNELSFDDKKGSEEIYLRCEKDLRVTVNDSQESSVGNTFSIRAGKTAMITAGEQLQLVCGDAEITLSKNGEIVVRGAKIAISGTDTVRVEGNPIHLNS